MVVKKQDGGSSTYSSFVCSRLFKRLKLVTNWLSGRDITLNRQVSRKIVAVTPEHIPSGPDNEKWQPGKWSFLLSTLQTTRNYFSNTRSDGNKSFFIQKQCQNFLTCRYRHIMQKSNFLILSKQQQTHWLLFLKKHHVLKILVLCPWVKEDERLRKNSISGCHFLLHIWMSY